MNEQDQLASELIRKAKRLEEQGLFDEALSCWQTALKQDPNPYLLCAAGRLATKMARWEEAEQFFVSAISLAPDIDTPYECLGLLYSEQDDFEVAKAYFEKCLAIRETAQVYTLLGVSQSKLGMIAAAKDSFEKALQLDPNYEEAYYNLALIFRNEQPAEAVALLQKALELDPKYALAHREIGFALRKLERYSEAEHHLRYAIELDDSDGWAYMYLGNLLWATGDLTSAEEAFKLAIKVWPDVSTPYWCLASFYEYQGRLQEATDLYEKSLEIDPDDSEANYRYGLLLKTLWQDAKARIYLLRSGR